ncbi:hypothetical protein ACFYM2_18170 [Streptomyces sp. NPDC006711]|uniref:hypothetical protein n=1 Tax=Streptomyces sp. NPDC006711 TaxID=3364762 RepID=UPI0036758C1D
MGLVDRGKHLLNKGRGKVEKRIDAGKKAVEVPSTTERMPTAVFWIRLARTIWPIRSTTSAMPSRRTSAPCLREAARSDRPVQLVHRDQVRRGRRVVALLR